MDKYASTGKTRKRRDRENEILMAAKLKTAVLGATGYSGLELARLLGRHPRTDRGVSGGTPANSQQWQWPFARHRREVRDEMPAVFLVRA
jgi:hypothetical protein